VKYPILHQELLVEDKGCFDFSLQCINADNKLVTRIKDNKVYESVCEKELPVDKDQHILKDELIRLSGKKAREYFHRGKPAS
jgi:hypothetical protein